jgi:hypothetical protein
MLRTTLAGILALVLVAGAAAQDEYGTGKGKAGC